MMKRTGVMLGLIALCASPALAANRLTDRDVRALVDRIDKGRGQFEDAVPNELKNRIVRGSSGEVNVKRLLDDFHESIDRLKERMKPDYAASAEVATMLRQASGLDALFRQQPPGTRGESEWNRLAADLKALAVAYGADFPLRENAAVRRIGDGELAEAIEQVARTGDQLKKSLDMDLKKDPAMDKHVRESIIGEADQFSKDAKALRDRVKDGTPSSGEADRLLARATTLQTFINSHQVATSASTWTSASAHLQMVAGAYGASWPDR